MQNIEASCGIQTPFINILTANCDVSVLKTLNTLSVWIFALLNIILFKWVCGSIIEYALFAFILFIP